MEHEASAAARSPARGSRRRVTGWAILGAPAVVWLGLAAGGCFEIAPLAPCDFNEQCATGEFCNRENGQCEVRQGQGGFGGVGGQGGAGGLGGAGGTVPFDMNVPVQKPNLIFLPVQGGSFRIGAEETEDRAPPQVVTVPSFSMMPTEVTVAQYRQCVEADVCRAPRRGAGCNYLESGRDNHPVNCVQWFDARSFADWMEARLPTESEWEYAARSLGAEDRTWPWGAEEGTCTDAVWSGLGDVCGQRTTLQGCSRVAGNTDQNLCDLAGNVREWVQDDYVPGYLGLPTDGRAVVSATGLKVLRGGGFGSTMEALRTFHRESLAPESSDEFTGFRLVSFD